MLSKNGYHIYATAGTATFLNSHGSPTTPVFWPDERPHAENNVMKMIAEHKFDLIVNIPKNHSKRELTKDLCELWDSQVDTLRRTCGF